MEKNVITKELEFAGKKLSLETGKLATMTNMSVKARYGDTVILVTVVSGAYNPDIDYFPLNVGYQEKFFASGSIKSSRFQKREGRSTDEAVIAGRMIDHAIRPLFPSDFYNETQVVATVLSLDQESDPEFLSMVAISAALQASNIPWDGPMTSVRVGYINNEYVLCPGNLQVGNGSQLDMMVSFVGKDKKFLAVEAEADALPEEKILGAIEFARNNVDPLYKLIKDFATKVNPKEEKLEYEPKCLPEGLLSDIAQLVEIKIYSLMERGLAKDEMEEQLGLITQEVSEKFEGKYKKIDMFAALEELKKKCLQRIILENGRRPDGRGVKEIRPITCEVGVLPRAHGSALFSRGVTQVMTIATLASPSQELLIQDMYGERSKKFLHYYNFPPYASGEVGRLGWPKNREIGHGMIAENALKSLIPEQPEFPYMIMLVSETLSSSGSTSMAATCGSTLALMDAGVPVSDMVGGIGVGLMAKDDFSTYLIMTDLAYLEDAFGLLDFKMTGTKTGVTAIQCDMKSKGIPFEILPKIIEQSREGRLQVLEIMEKTISQPRDSVSQYAPKTVSIKIDPEKIGLVIGSGGKTIREIQERTGTEIAIEDDGTVVISSMDKEKALETAEIVANMVKDVKAGEIYDGIIEEVVDFGAFVEILPGKVGLLHISEVSNEFVNNLDEVLKAGDPIKVKVLEVSRDGKMSLSKRALEPGGSPDRERPDRPERHGRSDRRGRSDRHDGDRGRSGGGKRPNNRYN